MNGLLPNKTNISSKLKVGSEKNLKNKERTENLIETMPIYFISCRWALIDSLQAISKFIGSE